MVEDNWRCRIMRLLLSMGLPFLSPCHVACMHSLFLVLGWRSYVTSNTNNTSSLGNIVICLVPAFRESTLAWFKVTRRQPPHLDWCRDLVFGHAGPFCSGHSRFLADGSPCKKWKHVNTLVFRWCSIRPRYSSIDRLHDCFTSPPFPSISIRFPGFFSQTRGQGPANASWCMCTNIHTIFIQFYTCTDICHVLNWSDNSSCLSVTSKLAALCLPSRLQRQASSTRDAISMSAECMEACGDCMTEDSGHLDSKSWLESGIKIWTTCLNKLDSNFLLKWIFLRTKLGTSLEDSAHTGLVCGGELSSCLTWIRSQYWSMCLWGDTTTM